jgi:transcriptional regulator with XRE-family HTH domain
MVAWSRRALYSLSLMEGEKQQRDRFAYALRKALDARDMSERQLAILMGIDARKIAGWRKGRTLPNVFEFQALAEKLAVKEELFKNPPDVPPQPPEPYYPIEHYLLEAVDRGAADGLHRPGPARRDGRRRGGRRQPPPSEGQP